MARALIFERCLLQKPFDSFDKWLVCEDSFEFVEPFTMLTFRNPFTFFDGLADPRDGEGTRSRLDRLWSLEETKTELRAMV